MAQTFTDTVTERIEIVDQPEESTERRRLSLRFVIPAITLLVASAAFILIRRARKTNY